MALRFIDSFSHYRTAQIPAKWDTVGPASPTIEVGVGRCGADAMQFDVTTGCWVSKGSTYTNAVGVTGFAMKVTLMTFGFFDFFFYGSVLQHHLALRWNQDGSIEVWRQDAGPVLLATSGPGVVHTGEWFYIEFKAFIDPAVGYVILKVNGTTVINATGLNTDSNSAPAGLTFIRLNAGASTTFLIGDLYTLDDTTGANNDFLGDTRVEYLHPDANGANQAWDVVPGITPHWQAVYDASGPDDDTTYIHTSTVGLLDTESFSNTGLPSGSIFGVQVGLYARKTDSGARTIAPVVRHGGIDNIGANQSPSFASYVYLLQLFATNPGTGVAWTISDVNNAEFGVKLTT